MQLVSGKYALVERSCEFTLVPWRPVIEKELGRQVSGLVRGDGISWGRKRGLGIGMERTSRISGLDPSIRWVGRGGVYSAILSGNGFRDDPSAPVCRDWACRPCATAPGCAASYRPTGAGSFSGIWCRITRRSSATYPGFQRLRLSCR